MNKRFVLIIASLLTLLLSHDIMSQKRKGNPYAPPSDLPLVERVISVRRDYKQALEALLAHYSKYGDVERAQWVKEELLSFHRAPKRAYRLELDVPPPTLRPDYNIPQANEMYRLAMSYKNKGGFRDSGDNVRRAEILFQRLLSHYPQSDKIDDTAYQLAEIYEGRVYKQYHRAAAYYERVVQWNPNTNTDARLRAARLYHQQIRNHKRAMQLYREVVTHDGDQKRVDEAKQRLAELSRMPG